MKTVSISAISDRTNRSSIERNIVSFALKLGVLVIGSPWYSLLVNSRQRA